MTANTSLTDLPVELLDMIFEQLSSLQDVIALRKTRLRFLQIYMRHEKRILQIQQERILTVIYNVISEHAPGFLRGLGGGARVPAAPIISILPQNECKERADKTGLALRVIGGLSFTNHVEYSNMPMFYQVHARDDIRASLRYSRYRSVIKQPLAKVQQDWIEGPDFEKHNIVGIHYPSGIAQDTESAIIWYGRRNPYNEEDGEVLFKNPVICFVEFEQF